MTVLKCKMCGAPLNNVEGKRIVVCEYCESEQTIPGMDDEKKVRMYDRANTYRLENEFDKASTLYESIVLDEPDEVEAYWGLCLCKYGVRYEEDPYTKKRIPTCIRKIYNSILDDENYINVIKKSDNISKEIYIKEAEEIDRIQKKSFELMTKGEDYDVFISYKQTDEQGEDTDDSIVALDLYEKLTSKGYKVFFSKITLQNFAGESFEPIIFSALNSAKVMLLVGTKIEYINSIWVKNEWERYLYLISQDKSRILIPIVKGIRPESLPNKLRNLQALDFSKLGAEQDLLYNLANKILAYGENKEEKRVENYTNSSPYVEIEKRKNGPALIDYVVAKGAKYSDQYFPDGGNLSSVDVRKFNYIAIQGHLLHKIKTEKNIEVGLIVYDCNTKNIVYKNSFTMTFKPGNDKFAMMWQINGSDGSSVSASTYIVGLWIGESKVTTLNLVVKENHESSIPYELRMQKYEEMKREVGINPKIYLLEKMLKKNRKEVEKYIKICEKYEYANEKVWDRRGKIVEGMLGILSILFIVMLVFFDVHKHSDDDALIFLFAFFTGKTLVISSLIKCRLKKANFIFSIVLIIILYIPHLIIWGCEEVLIAEVMHVESHGITGELFDVCIYIEAIIWCVLYMHKFIQYRKMKINEKIVAQMNKNIILPLEIEIQETLRSKYEYYVGSESVIILGLFNSKMIVEASKRIA